MATPHPRKALELFLSVGVGAGVALADLNGTLPAFSAHHGQHSQPQLLAEGGEGGEGGEGSGAAVQSNEELLVVLAQMQGHLLVAEELLQAGDGAAAEPHAGHPVDELYGAVEPALSERGLPGFLGSLNALRQQVQLDPSAASTTAKLKAAQQAIGKAEAAVSGNTLSVVQQLSAAAAEEYAAAVADGRVIEAIEYQDARGFLLAAQQRLQQDPAAPAAARAQIAAMLKAFPSAQPPARVVLTVEQLQSLQRGI